MIMKHKKPEFFVLRKDFHGNMKKYEVIEPLLRSFLTSKGSISKKSFVYYDAKFKSHLIQTKEQLQKYIKNHFIYHYWGKCECEFIAIDWPYRDTIDDSHPVKIDMYQQLEPNISVITDLVWNYIEPKMSKIK